MLVSPAGAGKTTAMHALRNAWELSHGPDTVVGLASSAAAAEVLADELGIDTENTAKWLHDHSSGRSNFRSGQLVIVDEAPLAGPRILDQITSHAPRSVSKCCSLATGRSSLRSKAGGAFGMLVRDRTNPRHDRFDAPSALAC